MAGLPFTIICLIVGAYPLFAEYMPGWLYGLSISPSWLVSNFAYGKLGMLGLPSQVMGEILIGFLVFAGMRMASGAGKFFLNFTLCLLGIWILTAGLEGYLLKVGRLELWSRPLLVAGGFLIAFPRWMTTAIGAALTALVIAVILIRRKTAAGKLITVSQ